MKWRPVHHLVNKATKSSWIPCAMLCGCVKLLCTSSGKGIIVIGSVSVMTSSLRGLTFLNPSGGSEHPGFPECWLQSKGRERDSKTQTRLWNPENNLQKQWIWTFHPWTLETCACRLGSLCDGHRWKSRCDVFCFKLWQMCHSRLFEFHFLDWRVLYSFCAKERSMFWNCFLILRDIVGLFLEKKEKKKTRKEKNYHWKSLQRQVEHCSNLAQFWSKWIILRQEKRFALLTLSTVSRFVFVGNVLFSPLCFCVSAPWGSFHLFLVLRKHVPVCRKLQGFHACAVNKIKRSFIHFTFWPKLTKSF